MIKYLTSRFTVLFVKPLICAAAVTALASGNFSGFVSFADNAGSAGPVSSGTAVIRLEDREQQ